MKLASMLIGTCVLGLALALTPMTAQAKSGRGSDDSRSRQDDCSGKSKGKNKKAARQEVRLQGRTGSDDTGAVAKAKYEEKKNSRRKFDVEVENAVPGTQFVVVVAGRTIATITANSFGVAKLELRPTPDDANELPIPSDFPRLKAGDVVQVGDMSVTLGARR